MAAEPSQPVPRNATVTTLILAAATLLGGFSLSTDDWSRYVLIAVISLLTDLVQPRAGRRAFQTLPHDAALYAAMLLLPGGAAALVGLVAFISGLMRGVPWRLAMPRAAVMAVAGVAGGYAVQLLGRIPGWPGQAAIVVASAAFVCVAAYPWNRVVFRAWRVVGLAELQAAAAGWLLAAQLGAGDYVAAVLTSGLFLLIRRHLLRRAHIIARHSRLARREHDWTIGMEAARDAVQRLEEAASPQALTEALAAGAVCLPGVAAVAVWEVVGNAPPRLAAFARPRPKAGQASSAAADDGGVTGHAVLSALPPPAIGWALRDGVVQEGIRCYVRLRHGPKVQSVAEISLQPGGDATLVLHLFGTVADYFHARLKNLDLLIKAQDDFVATVRVLAATVDARDHYTRQHSENVSAFARRIAVEMGLTPEETADIAMAGLLHDIGKIGIPDAILTKKGPLDVAERQLMMSHAEVGAQIVMQAEPLVHLAPLVRHHHEWHDGNGYPDGLKGEQIPLGAAIIAVADAYDTMTSDRPYRPGVKPDVAASELQRCAGTQFHPDVAAAAVRVLQRGSLPQSAASADVLPQEAQRTLAGRHHQAQYISVRMLQRLAAEMSLVLNLDELLNRSLAIIRDEMGFTSGGMLLKDPDGNIRVCAATGFLSPLVGLALPQSSGISRWVIEHGKPLRVDDVRSDARYYGGPGSELVGSEMAVPLTVAGETIGCVIVSSERQAGFTEQDEALLSAAAEPLAQAIRVALLHRSTLPATETDTLTGVLNRRGIEQALATALTGASAQQPRWLAAIDLRDLGRFNRRHGFRAGDAALQALGQHLAATLGGDAIIGRLSGDHFIALLPERTEAATTARLRDAAASWSGKKIEVAGAVSVVPPVNYGVIQYPHDLSSLDDVMTWADQFPLLTPQAVRKQATPSAGD